MEITDLAMAKDEKVNIPVPGTRNDSSTKKCCDSHNVIFSGAYECT
jgi:hypothetical protein